ncbi:hypothetical protein VNO78_11444 [Psophocarpus tetragonolobus]|uniref:Uncharacterized protein n=1 Tax=Psophocarpus tetragonolobus TaxID=3891 RepID=A0AAN9STV7_PSOTE
MEKGCNKQILVGELGLGKVSACATVKACELDNWRQAVGLAMNVKGRACNGVGIRRRTGGSSRFEREFHEGNETGLEYGSQVAVVADLHDNPVKKNYVNASQRSQLFDDSVSAQVHPFVAGYSIVVNSGTKMERKSVSWNSQERIGMCLGVENDGQAEVLNVDLVSEEMVNVEVQYVAEVGYTQDKSVRRRGRPRKDAKSRVVGGKQKIRARIINGEKNGNSRADVVELNGEHNGNEAETIAAGVLEVAQLLGIDSHNHSKVIVIERQGVQGFLTHYNEGCIVEY